MGMLRAIPSSNPIGGASAESVDMKFEVVVIPVDDGFRVVQFTLPG